MAAEIIGVKNPRIKTRRLGPTLFRYALRKILYPTLLALIGLLVALLAKDLLGFSDLVINRGLGMRTVAQIAFYEAITLASHTLPFAVLIGMLVALGRLSTNREIVALESLGISTKRLMPPMVAFGALAASFALLLSLYAVPRAAGALDRLLLRVAQEQPAASVRAGTIMQFGDWRLEAREASSSGDEMRGVLVWMPSMGETIFATSGSIVRNDSGGPLELVLNDGSLLPRPARWASEIRFATLRTELPRDNAQGVIEYEDPLRKSGLEELARIATTSNGDDPTLTRRAGIAFQRRFALPLATLIFGILSVPLFLRVSRPGPGGCTVTGLVATVIYYGLLQLGDGLVQAGQIGETAGAWLPNLVMLSVAPIFLLWSDRVPKQVAGSGVSSEDLLLPGRRERIRTHSLSRYVASQFVSLTVLAFAVLTTAYVLVDLLERLDWFAQYQVAPMKVLRFYGARTPLLATRMVPMALLAGAALTVGRLAQRGELIAMRSLGIWVGRGLRPILFVAAIAIPVDFVLNDIVVPRTNALADRFKETEIKEVHTAARSAIWYRAGDQVYHVSWMDPEIGEATGISIYEIGERGLPTARTDAAAARYLGNGMWRLSKPVRIEISTDGLHTGSAVSTIRLQSEPTEGVDTMHLGVRKLLAQIREAIRDGYDTTRFRVDLHFKLATPLACLLLPAVVLFFAIGGPPFMRPSLILVLSTALGVGWVLVSGAAAALGYGGAVPPVVAGWVVTVALAATAGGLALRNRN